MPRRAGTESMRRTSASRWRGCIVAKGDAASARAEATRAKQMSEEMGYYWGKVDAEEILNAQ